MDKLTYPKITTTTTEEHHNITHLIFKFELHHQLVIQT